MRVKHDIVIIGGGPAGMAAAVSAYDAGVRDVVILDREESLGGILKQCIHNGFGLHKLGEELTGPEYAAAYEKKVKERGIKVYYNTMAVSVTPERVVTAQSEEGMIVFEAGAVVLAMGCRERSRGALNIPGTRPAGVYSAGTAQKLMNTEGFSVGKKVVILGSGDIGLIMARRMTLEGAKVEAVCEIMPYSGGLKRNIVQCLDDFGIPLYLSTTVSEIHGDNRVTGVTIAPVDENRNPIEGKGRYIECDTLLLSVGLIPENELTRGALIGIDPMTNGAVVDSMRQTDIKGIFSCGNVLQVHDLVDYVSDEAELAGLGAAKFIKGVLSENGKVAVRAENGVRYALPQVIEKDNTEDVSLYLRVTKPFGRVKIKAECGGKVIASAVKIKVSPGEMEKLKLNKGTVTGEVTVSLEEL